MSSIRAQCGPTSTLPVTEADPARPTDAYGRSKLAAEEAVRASGAPYCILRPVLVYGAGAKGNLARLLELAQSPWPLPFGLCRNRRSLLARENLVDAIRLALESPALLGETCLVADPAPVTIADIMTALRTGMNRRPLLMPVPPALLALAFSAAGRREEWQRLGGEQVAEPAKLLAAGWRPVIETRAGLAAMAQAASPRKSGTASRSTP